MDTKDVAGKPRHLVFPEVQCCLMRAQLVSQGHELDRVHQRENETELVQRRCVENDLDTAGGLLLFADRHGVHERLFIPVLRVLAQERLDLFKRRVTLDLKLAQNFIALQFDFGQAVAIGAVYEAQKVLLFDDLDHVVELGTGVDVEANGIHGVHRSGLAGTFDGRTKDDCGACLVLAHRVP